MIQFGFADPENVRKFMLAQSGGMKKVANRATADMVMGAAGYAKEQATISPKQQTRAYWGSIHAVVEKKTSRFVVSGKIGSNMSYAPALERGSKPHDIYPKNKKALAWGSIGNKITIQQFDAGTGKFKAVRKGRKLSLKAGAVRLKRGKSLGKFIRKHVHHPGTRAYHVLENAAKKAVANAQEFVNKALAFYEAKP